MSALSQRTPKERLWLVGGVLGAVFIAMIGWLFFISPQRSDTGTVNDEAQSVRLQNVALQTRIASLQSQSKNMTDVSKSLAAARLALPATSGVPAFLRTLQSLGSSTGTDVVSLSVGPPLDVSAVAAGTAGTAAGTAGAAAASGAAATTAPAAPAGTTAAPTGPGVYGLAITAQVNGSPDQLNRFLERLQSVQPRAVLITQLAQGGATGGAASEASSGTSLQLTMQAFVAPASPSEQSQLSAASSGN